MKINFTCRQQINTLPNDKFLGETKLKALADGKLNVAKIMIFLFDRSETTVVNSLPNDKYRTLLN